MNQNFDIIIVGGGAAGCSISYFKLKKRFSAKSEGSNVDQSGAQSGGDIVGRDKTTKA
mgnify:CR=1 FL=1